VIQVSSQLNGLITLFSGLTEWRQMPSLPPMPGYGLALDKLAQAVAVAFVLAEVVLHLCDLQARLQIEYSRGDLQVLSLYALLLQLAGVEMQTF
jgi:hypothetical protein